MLDWIKYFPLDERERGEVSEIRGPYFPWLVKQSWVIGDNALNFKAPKSNPIFRFFYQRRKVKSITPKKSNVLNLTGKEVYCGPSVGPECEWNAKLFYSNIWYFVGPWFTGYQASLESTALIVSSNDHSLFSDKNLFHPNVFENSIANFLDNLYGYENTGKAAHYRGPLNWKVLSISNTIKAVVCDMHFVANAGKENPTLVRKVFFPVSPTQFVCINFDFGGTEIYNDKIRSEPLFKLCDSIINSITLEVGEATKAEWSKVKATCPDMHVTNTFGELPWPIKYEKLSKSRKEFDVTPKQKKRATLTNRISYSNFNCRL